MKFRSIATHGFSALTLLVLAGLLLPAAAAAEDRHKALSAMPRIVGGDKADAGAWPWMAALVNGPDNYANQFCGGALVDPRWVVTAAHCVVSESFGPGAEVLVGVDNLGEPGTRIEITNAYVHPGYFNSSGLAVPDIALLELAAPAVPTPIPFYRGSSDLVGVTATIIGWGSTTDRDDPVYPLDLMEAQVPIVPTEVCEVEYNSLGYEITDLDICAGFSGGGVDSCTGDSGGPMMIDAGGGGAWQLAGIVSWGHGCALAGYYGVYTRVSALVDWIDDTMNPLAGDYDGNGSLGLEDSIGILQEVTGLR